MSTIEPPDAPPELVALVFPEDSTPWRAITLNGLMPVTMAGNGLGFNSPEVHQIQVPAANTITNARSLARLYAATIGEVDGIRLLQPETVAAASVIRSEGKPWGESFDGPKWGTGFLRPFPRQPMFGGAVLWSRRGRRLHRLCRARPRSCVQPRHQPDDHVASRRPAHGRLVGCSTQVCRPLNPRRL